MVAPRVLSRGRSLGESHVEKISSHRRWYRRSRRHRWRHLDVRVAHDDPPRPCGCLVLEMLWRWGVAGPYPNWLLLVQLVLRGRGRLLDQLADPRAREEPA